MIKTIIFDCFGVLVTDALEAIVSELRMTDAETADEIVALVHAASKGAMDPQAARAAIADKLGITTQEYANKIRHGEAKNRPLLEYIQGLRPQYKTALLSNVIRGGLESRFTARELAAHFDAVVASGDIGYAKPEAQAYQAVADRLGVRLDECIMVDDRQDYCDGAIAIGMQAVRYKSFGQMQTELARLLAS